MMFKMLIVACVLHTTNGEHCFKLQNSDKKLLNSEKECEEFIKMSKINVRKIVKNEPSLLGVVFVKSNCLEISQNAYF